MEFPDKNSILIKLLWSTINLVRCTWWSCNIYYELLLSSHSNSEQANNSCNWKNMIGNHCGLRNFVEIKAITYSSGE